MIGDARRCPALHGGVVSTLIDTAGGVAAWSALGAAGDAVVSTVDLTVDFPEPAGLGGPRLRRPRPSSYARVQNRVSATCARVTQDGVLVAEGRGVWATTSTAARPNEARPSRSP